MSNDATDDYNQNQTALMDVNFISGNLDCSYKYLIAIIRNI